jgi:hypothetical protein
MSLLPEGARMRRLKLAILALALVGGAALAQSGGLAGVTMRVLDDIAGLDAAIIEVGAARAAN